MPPSRHRIALLLGVACGALAGTAPAQSTGADDRISLSGEMQLLSRYIWRGYDLGGGRPAVQSSAELHVTPQLVFDLWLTSLPRRGRAELDEVQLGAYYSRDVGSGIALTVGHVTYLTRCDAGARDLGAFSSSGEVVLSLSRAMGEGSATLTYARGYREATGHSLNLWLERSVAAAGGGVAADPYLQVDYLAAFGAPGTLRDRLAAVEVGLPLSVPAGPARATLAAAVTWIPSPFVQSANAEMGASNRGVIPWVAVRLTYPRE